MTKEEIYEAIGYNGKYNKEVKRKLRLLMKKFHPDLNHEDKETIKLLVEVKDELLNNKVSYVKQKNKHNLSPNQKETDKYTDVTHDDFDKISIDALTNKVNQLLNDIMKLQEKLYKLYKKLTKEEREYLKIEKERRDNLHMIQEVKEELLRVKKMYKVEVFFFVLVIINLFLLIFKSHFVFIFSLIFMTFFYILFLIFKNLKINKFTNMLYDLEIDALLIKKELEVQDEVVMEIRYKTGSLKRSIQRLKDDITFYNHVIAKKANKEKTTFYDHKNVYTKRK